VLYVNRHLRSIKRLKQQGICIKDNNQHSNRTIRLLIVNLMPKKIDTEFQFLSLIGSLPLDVTVDFLHMKSHKPKNSDSAYLAKAYKTFHDIQELTYDRVIITGAPLEFIPFSEIHYWEELTKIFSYTHQHAASTLYICWAAVAGLYYHHDLKKLTTVRKIFGIFPHTICEKHDLLNGLNNGFLMPHSRYVYLNEAEINQVAQLEILIKSKEAGITLVKSKDNRHIYLTAHPEYEKDTLQKEYERDQKHGIRVQPPKNDNLTAPWLEHAKKFFENWLNL